MMQKMSKTMSKISFYWKSCYQNNFWGKKKIHLLASYMFIGFKFYLIYHNKGINGFININT